MFCIGKLTFVKLNHLYYWLSI